MSPAFMLDTDTVSYAIRGHGDVAGRIAQHRPSDLCMSAITLAELRFGADRRNSRKLHRLIDAFSKDVAVIPFDEACGAAFGRIANELATEGSPIGDFDTLIAAQAMVLGVVLVTNNTRHFDRVRGLKLENWV